MIWKHRVSFKLYLIYLYFASPKFAVLLVEGIWANLMCTVSVYQNQSVAYIISGPPPAPGCLPEWTAAVSTTRLFFLWRCALCLQTFLQSGRNNHASNTFFFFFFFGEQNIMLVDEKGNIYHQVVLHAEPQRILTKGCQHDVAYRLECLALRVGD